MYSISYTGLQLVIVPVKNLERKNSLVVFIPLFPGFSFTRNSLVKCIFLLPSQILFYFFKFVHAEKIKNILFCNQSLVSGPIIHKNNNYHLLYDKTRNKHMRFFIRLYIKQVIFFVIKFTNNSRCLEVAIRSAISLNSRQISKQSISQSCIILSRLIILTSGTRI